MYAVIELQKTSEDQISTLVNAYHTLNEAYNKWHTVLAYAAVSTLPIHSAVILADTGEVIASEYFAHEGE